MARLRWQVDALADLTDIAEYIGHQSPSFAPHFVSRIVDAAESIEALPWRGRVVPELERESIRELIFQNYRIVYGIDPDVTFLLGVIHGAMDLLQEAEARGWLLT